MSTYISNPEATKVIDALRKKGMSDEQIAEVLMTMQFDDAGMSRSDGITVVKSEPDVPGAYVDQYQKAMDTFGQQLIQQEQAARASETKRSMNGELPIDQYYANPNVRIETEGQRTTVSPNGNIVIY